MNEIAQIRKLSLWIFFIPLLAALSFTSPVLAEDIWLILRYGHVSIKGNSAALEKIKMSSMDQCQIMGSRFASTERVKNEYKFTIFGFNCIES